MEDRRRSFDVGSDSRGKFGTLLGGRIGPSSGDELADDAGVDRGVD